MKQHITKEQLNELNAYEVKIYDNWLLDHGYVNNEISIGQMIEFLYQHGTVVVESEESNGPRQGWYVNKNYIDLELCDALWEAVKDILNKK